MTALVRHSIRAFAFVRSSPAQVLGAVNEVMLGHALAQRFATVVLARLDLDFQAGDSACGGCRPPSTHLARGRWVELVSRHSRDRCWEFALARTHAISEWNSSPGPRLSSTQMVFWMRAPPDVV